MQVIKKASLQIFFWFSINVKIRTFKKERRLINNIIYKFWFAYKNYYKTIRKFEKSKNKLNFIWYDTAFISWFMVIIRKNIYNEKLQRINIIIIIFHL